MHDLGSGVGGPGHDAHGGRVGHQMHISVVRLDHLVIRGRVGKVAGHTHGNHGFGQTHATVFGEFFAGQNFSTRHAGEVRHQAFDFGDAACVEPLRQIGKGFDVLVGKDGIHDPSLTNIQCHHNALGLRLVAFAGVFAWLARKPEKSRD